MRSLLVVFVVACGPTPRAETDTPADAAALADALVGRDALACSQPPPAGPDVALAPPYDTLYAVFDLGPVPGVPSPLGGTAILATDPDTLLVAGSSENAAGAIYSIGITRDACGHIAG